MLHQNNQHNYSLSKIHSKRGFLSFEMRAKFPFIQTHSNITLLSQLFMLISVVFLISSCIQMRTVQFDNYNAATTIVLSSNSLRSLYNNNDPKATAFTEILRNAVSEQPSQTGLAEDVSLTKNGNTDVIMRSSETEYIDIPKRKTYIQTNIVQAGDYIYFQDDESWDSAPIVIESHKLIFFTIPKVGCTIWKQLFRRMMNYTDWMVQDYDIYQPHNPNVNGLMYLYNYTLKEASIMMTSPEWTRAMMVRDPKTRYLSAFLDKAVGNFHTHIRDRCCPVKKDCIEGAQTIEGFVKLCAKCNDDHWRPQYRRIDYKYWPYIDHISHLETAASDTEDLLRKIGAWEEYGESGWGENGMYPIFGSKESTGAGMNHTTFADYQVWKWYTPASEKLVEGFFQGDYENPLFQFQRQCLTCIE